MIKVEFSYNSKRRSFNAAELRSFGADVSGIVAQTFTTEEVPLDTDDIEWHPWKRSLASYSISPVFFEIYVQETILAKINDLDERMAALRERTEELIREHFPESTPLAVRERPLIRLIRGSRVY